MDIRPDGDGFRHTPLAINEIETSAKRLYSWARCGLYHTGLASEGIFLTEMGGPIVCSRGGNPTEINAIVIDVGKFIDNIEEEFNRYVQQLRDPAQNRLRENFNRAWDLLHSGKPIEFPPHFDRIFRKPSD